MELTYQSKIICGECEAAPPCWDCKDCRESYCDQCKEKVHTKGLRKQHTEFERITPCGDCESYLASRKCEDCRGKVYCESCFIKTHNRTDGKYRRHSNYDLFGVKQKPFIDPDNNNGFGIDVRSLVVSDTRCQEYVPFLSETVSNFNETHEIDRFVDVEGVVWNGSRALSCTALIRRIGKISEGEEFEDPAVARSVVSSRQATSTAGMSIVSLETAVNTSWHRERKPHYLFELPNNSLLSGPHANLRGFNGVTSLCKFISQFESGETASPESQRREQAFDLALSATAAINRLIMENFFISAQYYNSLGLLFFRFFDLALEQWVPLYVDDTLPCDATNTVPFGYTEQGRETWKMFLTKAYAKFRGSMRAVENETNLHRVLRQFTAGNTTIDTWSNVKMGDPEQAATLSSFLWWYTTRCVAFNSIIILSRVTVDDSKAAGAKGFLVHEHHCNTEDECNAVKHTDCANAAIGLFGLELTTQTATAMGLRRETVGNGLRLIQLRQFSQWQQESSSTDIQTSTPMRFRYYHSSPLWTKELRQYFGFNVADDDLVYATVEDIIGSFNSITVCSLPSLLRNPGENVLLQGSVRPARPKVQVSGKLLKQDGRSTTRLFTCEVFKFTANVQPKRSELLEMMKFSLIIDPRSHHERVASQKLVAKEAAKSIPLEWKADESGTLWAQCNTSEAFAIAAATSLHSGDSAEEAPVPPVGEPLPVVIEAAACYSEDHFKLLFVVCPEAIVGPRVAPFN